MPLTDEERADLEAMSSGQISDAMEALNLRRSVVTGFMMLAAPGSKVVGTAVTVRQVPKSANEEREARLTRHPVMLGQVEVNPGDIIFADETGILVIPEAKKAMVLAKANEIRRLEETQRANVS
jgi:regulator of RNase E activity RraA